MATFSPASHCEGPGDPAITEHTPLLSGPLYEADAESSGISRGAAISSWNEVSTMNNHALCSSDLSNSLLRRNEQEYDVYRCGSCRQGFHHSEENPRSSSATFHDSVVICSSSPFSTPSRVRLLSTSLSQSISLRLENSGSVARDHLASERTFLAYMRTSLAIASSGVALVQLFSVASSSLPIGSTHRLEDYIRPLGASAVSIGLLVLFIGIARYFTVQAALIKGYFPVARLATGAIAVVLTALVTLTFAILIAGKLEVKPV